MHAVILSPVDNNNSDVITSPIWQIFANRIQRGDTDSQYVSGSMGPTQQGPIRSFLQAFSPKNANVGGQRLP